MATYDDDKEALAAEYVLGTLSADERDQAEALLSVDPRFEEVVRQWERRLGELNVMVEAVEPPPQLWDKVKATVESVIERPFEAEAAEADEAPALPHVEETELHAPETPEEGGEESSSDAPGREEVEELGTAAVAAALEASLLPPDEEPPSEAQPKPEGPAPARASLRRPGKIERSADVIHLAGRMRRWRQLTFVCGAIAALLAVYVAVWQVAPDLVPPPLRPAGFAVARGPAPARAQQDRLVAVLQQEPTAPAFLLTFDTRSRTLFVRRVAAAPEAGHSYQLWLISKKFPAPRSLGLVGPGEFTQRAFPANFDADTLRAASYAVSLEPAAGAPGEGPSGPILFTGKAVESLPATPPPAKT